MATKKKPEPRFASRHILICEEARPELGGKLTILGFYGGDTIVVGSESATLRSLTFVFSFDVLRGKQPTEATFRLQRPDGQPAAPELTMTLGEGSARSKTVVVQTNGLEVSTGSYVATLRVESQRLTKEFHVRCDPDVIARIRAASSVV